MSINYQTLSFEYQPCREQSAQSGADQAAYPVVVVGAGPVGLATAIDLAQQGVPTVLLDNDDTVSSGSRAICFTKGTLESFDLLGCGVRMMQKGVTWTGDKVFLHE